MQINHRKEFKDSKAGSRWHEATGESWFHDGLKVALLTLPLPIANDAAQAAANFYRIQGAQMLAGTLCDLTEEIRPPYPSSTANLNHKS